MRGKAWINECTYLTRIVGKGLLMGRGLDESRYRLTWSYGNWIDDCDKGHMSGRMKVQVELEWWEREQVES